MTREDTFMTAQKLNATLEKSEEGANSLNFELPSGTKRLNLDDETNEAQVKELFNTLLTDLLEEEFEFCPVIPEDRKADLYGEVSSAYISQLNQEIARVRSKMVDLGIAQ